MAPVHAEEDELAQLFNDLEGAQAQALWALKAPLMSPTPRPAMLAHQWSGATLRALCERARRLVPMEMGGDRRVFTLANPGLGGLPFATPTVSCAYQTLGPGEVAPAHRHAPAALRFILEGNGVWTTVDGDSCDMREGDLVLTPSWTFHDHRNDGDGTMTWFDGLDLPLVKALDAIFYQPKPDAALPVETPHRSESRFVAAGLVPDDGDVPDVPWSKLVVYRWAATDLALGSLLARSSDGSAVLRFTDPMTGADALPTIGSRMMRLAPGGHTVARRRTGSGVFVAYRGSGRSIIDGVAFDWEPGDVVSIPSWAAVEHQSTDGADVFLMSDDPVLRALHLYREERLPEPQVVTDRFEA